MKLVTYNIRFGLGLDQQIDLGRIAGAVQDADIIALQEVERFWKHSGMVDQPEILASHMEKFYWSYCPAFDIDASTRNNEEIVFNRRRQFGPMVLSRWPIRMSRIIVFPKLGTLNILNMDTGAIECVIYTPSGPLKVYSLHLSPVSSRDRLMQIDRLLEFHRNAQVSGGAWTGGEVDMNTDPVEAQPMAGLNWNNGETPPVMPEETVVMGDFNSIPDSDEYDRMVGAQDLFNGRVGHLDGFVDSWTCARERADDRTSWWPDPPEQEPGHGLCLDHCFISPCLAQQVERAWVDRAAEGSDHRPYWVELNF